MGKKIILSKHVTEKKIPLLKSLGWNITESKIEDTIINPRWRGVSIYNQPTALSLMDKNHILRVIFIQNDGIIFVVTIHIAERGRYESTK